VADGNQAYAYVESLSKFQLTASAPATLTELGEAKVVVSGYGAGACNGHGGSAFGAPTNMAAVGGRR